MHNLVDINGVFIHSQQPSDIHHYECFDDQSKLRWVDGSEYSNHPSWSETEKRRWHFFYRPYNYGDNIGSHQKEKIKEILPTIHKLKEELSSFVLLKYFAIFLFLPIFVFCIYAQSWFFLAVPVVSFAYFYFKCQDLSNQLRHEEQGCRLFEAEIDYLIDQQQMILNNRLSSDEILDMFWSDIRELETEILEDHFNDETGRVIREVENFYSNVSSKLGSNKKITLPPIFPVIPSWGLLREFNSQVQHCPLKPAAVL